MPCELPMIQPEISFLCYLDVFGNAAYGTHLSDSGRRITWVEAAVPHSSLLFPVCPSPDTDLPSAPLLPYVGRHLPPLPIEGFDSCREEAAQLRSTLFGSSSTRPVLPQPFQFQGCLSVTAESV